MAVTIDHKDGWLFPDAQKNAVHEIDVNDPNELLKMANADEMWAESVRQQVYDRLQAKNDGAWKNRPRTDWIVEELQVMNSPGTVFHFPFGLRIITFASKRHLFRGENKRYPSTVSCHEIDCLAQCFHPIDGGSRNNTPLCDHPIQDSRHANTRKKPPAQSPLSAF